MDMRKTSAAFFAGLFVFFALCPTCLAATIDGNLAEWTYTDRLDIIPQNSGVSGSEVYNTYDSMLGHFQVGVRSTALVSGASATIYINSDLNSATGFKVFGSTVGAEYVITVTNLRLATQRATLSRYSNFATGATTFVTNLPVASSLNSLEFSIPKASLIGATTGVGMYFSLNNSVYLPKDYAIYQYVARTQLRPRRSDSGRRLGIVYSATTAARYFDKKAYSQLFMATQHQAMMAGVPFDLLNEDEILDVNNLVNFDGLVFPLFSHVKAANRVALEASLTEASLRYRIGFVVAGNFLTNDESGAPFSLAPYRTLNNLLGITPVSSGTANSIKLVPGDTTHSIMKNYLATDVLRLYQTSRYTIPVYQVFKSMPGIPARVLVNQLINGTATANAAVVATATGGRNIHFGSDRILGDTDVLWSALRWVAGSSGTGTWLKMGRGKSIFLSRNDMDMARIYSQYSAVLTPLAAIVTDWKNRFGFVGSFYVPIGNNSTVGEYTDWVRNTPFYKSLAALGNEIGNHSYTHASGKWPVGETYTVVGDINKLTNAQLQFEFKTANELIQTKTGIPITGAAVPGMPDTLDTDLRIESLIRFAHLTGGFSGTDYSLGLTLGPSFEKNEGSGFHGAFGYLTPSSSMLYFSPNLTPDFSIIQFRRQSPQLATSIWKNEYNDLLKFASQPIIQWAWHDYGITTGITASPPYSKAMYEETVKHAFLNGAEFVTGKDLSQRIPSLMNTKYLFSASSPHDVSAIGSNLGTFSLEIEQAKGATQVIQKVENWYAFDNSRVFLPDNGGRFKVALGATGADETRITSLPMRARLKTLSGNGTLLQFSFEGEGIVTVNVKTSLVSRAIVTGADSVTKNGTKFTLRFGQNKVHTVSIR